MDWELDDKESRAPKNWYFWTVVLDKTLESPLNCKEIKPVHPKGNQSWIFIGRIDAETETLILWPPDVKNWHIRKDPDAGKDWRQEEKGSEEDEMVGWHNRLNGCEFEYTPGVRDGQRGLVCCISWGSKESDIAERLNWTELKPIRVSHSIVSDSLWPENCSPPGSSVHGILQARILEWVAIPFSTKSFRSRNQTLQAVLYSEPPGKPKLSR